MRKYSKWLLVLAVVAAVPAVASADGFLGGRQLKTSVGNSAQNNYNQRQAEQVKAALKNSRIDGYGITIEVIRGTVKLNGKVRNPSHLARAGEVCQQVPGITRVVNELEYVPQQKAPANSASLLGKFSKRFERQAPVQHTSLAIQRVNAQVPAGPSNQQVAEQVGKSLKQIGLAGKPVSIHYQTGVLTLTGQVDSAAQYSAAAESAARVPGVTSVNNQLQLPQTAAAPQMTPVSYEQQFSAVGYPQQVQPTSAMSQVPASPVSIAGVSGFSHPQLPSHAWPAYAQYPNSAAVTYPTQYSASAFPYIGPFYPYPQVPMGWREAKLQWDDGFWNLNFNQTSSVWETLFNPNGK